MNQSDLYHELHEAYHVYEEIRCNDCDGERIDLSEADDFDEAVEIWNNHVDEVHTENDRGTEGDS